MESPEAGTVCAGEAQLSESLNKRELDASEAESEKVKTDTKLESGEQGDIQPTTDGQEPLDMAYKMDKYRKAFSMFEPDEKGRFKLDKIIGYLKAVQGPNCHQGYLDFFAYVMQPSDDGYVDLQKLVEVFGGGGLASSADEAAELKKKFKADEWEPTLRGPAELDIEAGLRWLGEEINPEQLEETARVCRLCASFLRDSGELKKVAEGQMSPMDALVKWVESMEMVDLENFQEIMGEHGITSAAVEGEEGEAAGGADPASEDAPAPAEEEAQNPNP